MFLKIDEEMFLEAKELESIDIKLIESGSRKEYTQIFLKRFFSIQLFP